MKTFDSTGCLQITDEAVRARIRCHPDFPTPSGAEAWHAAGWLRGQIHALGAEHGLDPLDLDPGKNATYEQQRGHRLAHAWLLSGDDPSDAMRGQCCRVCPQLMLADLIGMAAGIALIAAHGNADDAHEIWQAKMIMQGITPDPLFTPAPREPLPAGRL